MPSYSAVCERVGCGCLLAAAVLLAALIATAVRAAPTPRPVERLTPELMPGVWDCRWGGTSAWVAFSEDGTFSYGTDREPTYCGVWEIRGGELWMRERHVNGLTWTEYTIGELRLDRYPFVTGRARGGFQTPVTLSNPRRFAE